MQNLFPRAARLYLMRLDDLRASLFVASLPPAPGLTASSCSCGREFATRLFRLRLAVTPCVYGCRHRPRLAPFIHLDSAHAGHSTRAYQARCAEPETDATIVAGSAGRFQNLSLVGGTVVRLAGHNQFQMIETPNKNELRQGNDTA